MINRDSIEAGDKVYTRDGGCLVARVDAKEWEKQKLEWQNNYVKAAAQQEG